MFSKTLVRLGLALSLLLAPSIAWAQGAMVGHYSEFCETSGFFLEGDDGVILAAEFQTNPGDFRRTNANGMTWIHIAGQADFTVITPGLGVTATGTGSFSINTTAVAFDGNPCGDWIFDLVRTTIHVTASLTDVEGTALQLLVQAIFRDGETVLLRTVVQ